MKLTSKQENALRALYVKALRLANGEPTEVEEIRHLYSEVLGTTISDSKFRKAVKTGKYTTAKD